MNYFQKYKDLNPQSYNDRIEALKKIFKEVAFNEDIENFSLDLHKKMKGSLGRCTYNFYTKYLIIEMNDVYVKKGDWKVVLDTLLHECAHAIDANLRGKSSHGKYWKRIAARLGAKPVRQKNISLLGDTFNKAIIKQAKYTSTCPECGYQTPGHRKTKHTYGHVNCNTPQKKKERGSFLPFEITQNY